MKNGDRIEAKINEVTPKLVKYKRFKFLEGPSFSIDNEDIKMIIYENGNKDVFDGKRFVTNLKSKQKTSELLPSSRVFLKFKKTEGEKSVDGYDAIKMLKRYLTEMVHCEIVDSKINADFIFELYLFKKIGAQRRAKIKVIFIPSGDMTYETDWIHDKGSRSVIIKTIEEGLIQKYPEIGRFNL